MNSKSTCIAFLLILIARRYSGAGREKEPPNAAHARSAHAGLCRGEGTARRRRSAARTPTATSSSARRTIRAPEMTAQDGVPQGTIFNFTMNSADSKIYPGIARDAGTFGTPDPNDPAKLDRHHQPSGALHAQGRGLRAQAIRARHRRAVHRRRRRPRHSCCSRRSTT